MRDALRARRYLFVIYSNPEIYLLRRGRRPRRDRSRAVVPDRARSFTSSSSSHRTSFFFTPPESPFSPLFATLFPRSPRTYAPAAVRALDLLYGSDRIRYACHRRDDLRPALILTPVYLLRLASIIIIIIIISSSDAFRSGANV